FFVDDGDKEVGRAAHRIGSEIQSLRIVESGGLNRAMAAEVKGFDAKSFWVNLIVALGIAVKGVGAQPFGVLEVHAAGALRGPPVEDIKGLERGSKSVARVGDAVDMVVQLRDSEGQALRSDGFQDRAVKLGIIGSDPFPGEHAFNGLRRVDALLSRVAADIGML